MDTKMMINIAIDWAGLVICVICIAITVMEKRMHREPSLYFILYFTVLILLIGSCIIAEFCWDMNGALWVGLARVFNFTMVFSSFVQALMVSLFFLDILGREPLCRRLRIVFVGITGFQMALLIMNPFTGILYGIDAANHIRMESLFHPVTFLSGVMVITDLILLLYNREYLSPGTSRDFLIYFTFPLVGMILQFFVYGIHILMASLMLATTIMFFSFLKRETARYYQQMQENERIRTRMMLSQIQPHFLYNSLGVIQELCHTDPVKAEEATEAFSRFLRRNMDSLSMERPIPFSDELEHTKNYLELERMRFGDQLQVEYDIGTTDFMIPTLTLQPMVENAVQHGIRQKEEGGTISIRTRDFQDHIEIRVCDDGPGIGPDDVTDPKASGRIGIRNVTERIREMCGGDLQMEFNPGTGAIVHITLPKKEAK